MTTHVTRWTIQGAGKAQSCVNELTAYSFQPVGDTLLIELMAPNEWGPSKLAPKGGDHTVEVGITSVDGRLKIDWPLPLKNKEYLQKSNLPTWSKRQGCRMHHAAIKYQAGTDGPVDVNG